MKIKLNITIDFEDMFDGWDRSEISQFIGDEYIQYVCVKHNEDALNEGFRGKIGTENEDKISRIVFDEQVKLAKITDRPKWSFEILQEQSNEEILVPSFDISPDPNPSKEIKAYRFKLVDAAQEASRKRQELKDPPP